MPSILVLGEAYGAEEEKERAPFVGASGYHLTKMLAEAGINRADCYMTNVFNLRPKGNKIETLCGLKPFALPSYPALLKGKYVRKDFATELSRLADELDEINPNLVICLGNTAMWAMLGKTTISKFRGTTELSTHTVAGFKVLSTYHPAAVLRDWSLRPVVVSDFVKAAREREFPEIRRPKREIWIEPTLEDLDEFKRQFIKGCRRLTVDIETAGQQITCIGFAPNPGCGLVVPFYAAGYAGRCYWRTLEDECAAWAFAEGLLLDPKIEKVFQNGLYDIAFLWRAMGIKVINAEHDTMLLHHSLQPESLKGLGFLGSLYCDEGPWKHMRTDNETIKRDE